MKRLVPFILIAACGGTSPTPTRALVAAPATPSKVTPPVAERRDHVVTSPHGDRVDPYYWLRDDERQDPAVIGYLTAENAHTDAVLAPTQALQTTLFDEIVGRIKQDDSTVPKFDNGYWYYTRYETGQQYPIHARRKGTMEAPEHVLLDVNKLAEGHDFYSVGNYEVSPDNRLLAYAEDTVGRFQYALRVLELDTGELLPDTAVNISGALAWAADSTTLLYVAKHPTTLRSYRVYRHQLGGAGAALVYEESDGTYYTGISTTKSNRFIEILLSSTETSEVRLIDAEAPTAPPIVFAPREPGHKYSIDHVDGRFVIRTNWHAKNYRLMTVPETKQSDRAAWVDVLPHRADAFVQSFALYRGFVAASVRTGGLRKVEILPNGGKPFVLDADDPTYTMFVVDTPDGTSTRARYRYTSLTTPWTTYEVDADTGERTLLRRDPVLGDFDSADYVTEYLHATATDGTKVPVSIVYRNGTPRDGTAPVLQGGYGSYGSSRDPVFQSQLLSLLDRGWVYAIAHVRGGQEHGRAWYEAGRQLAKMTTFTDFIAVSRYLVAERYAAPDTVFAIGGSAGGLLMGAVINLAPDQYRGVIAHVPFVDVVTTMLDESIPLTSNEYDEWGDPRDKASYDYILGYSPYDNVEAKGYPAMLVTTGLWDSQVQYFEPAKWVAKLRATKTDDNIVLLHTNMDAGHGGKSGRYNRYRKTARDYAFLLHVLDQPDARRR